MKIKGKITLLFDREGAILELSNDVGVQFARARLNPKQVCSMLSRKADVSCEITLQYLDIVTQEAPK